MRIVEFYWTEDGILVLVDENDDKWHCKNAYPTSMIIEGLDYDTSETATITLTTKYNENR